MKTARLVVGVGLGLAGVGCNTLVGNGTYEVVDASAVSDASASSSEDATVVTDGGARDAETSDAAVSRPDAEAGLGDGGDAGGAPACVPPSGTCTPSEECQQSDGVYVCDDGALVCVSGPVQNGTACGGPDSGTVCSDGGCVSCNAGANCSDPGACVTKTYACSTGTAVCAFESNVPQGTPCGGDAGFVCNDAGSCVACSAGSDCSVATSCAKQTIDCSSGTAVCTPAGNKADGTSCGTGMYCYGGTCSTCTVNASCTPTNPCHQGTVSACTGGAATCSDTGQAVTPGTVCGTNSVCNGSGSCVSCQASVSCQPSAPSGNPCHTGETSCSTGASTCVDTGANAAPGTSCGTNSVCNGSGSCVSCMANQSCTPGSPANPCHSGTTSCATGTQTCTDDGPVANGLSCGTAGENMTCNSGACGCAAGLISTCDGGACIDPMTDPNNCGACGHSCLGAGCNTGLCEPIVLGTVTGNGLGIAVDSANVYFTNGRTSVYGCPLTGCPSTPAAINAGFTNTTQLHYSSSTGALYVGDLGAGTETSLTTSGGVNWQAAELLDDPQGETEDATYLYVGDDGQIDRFVKSSGAFTVLSNGIGGFVWGVWYDSSTNNVFGAVNGTSGGGLMVSCPVSGAACTQITLATGGPAFETIVIGSTVYWVDGGNPAMNNSNGGLFSANSADLSNVQAVAAGANYGFALALTADSTNIYFTSGSSGNVYSCAIAGCAGAPTAIATGQGSARAIVTDSSAVYWVNDAGQVVKVAK